ncbi:hypothetical protein MHB42_08585 [Lysinibacillus sp. FSL K6-0232]
MIIIYAYRNEEIGGTMMVSAILQVLLFAVIPFIWWFFTARNKEPFQA